MLTPKFKKGDTLYLGVSRQDGIESLKCPDCLGDRVWYVENTAGFKTTVECPRCRGNGVLSQRCYAPHVQEVRIDGVRLDEMERDPLRAIMYAQRLSQASLTSYRECDLHRTREEAQAAAEAQAKEDNERLEELQPERQRIRHLSTYQLRDAEMLEARWAYDRLVERICELDEHPLAGGEFETRSCTLTKEQVRIVQESLVWLDDKATRVLQEWREQE